MALIEISQGDTRTLSVIVPGSDGAPINISGYLIRGVAKRKYSESDQDAIVNTLITGAAPEALTGLFYFPLTTGNTANCAGDYIFAYRLYGPSGSTFTYPTDGLRILPTPYIPTT